MKTYKSFDEIEYDLKRLKLEREIGLEQLKGIKSEIVNDLRPLNWISTVATIVGKYGLIVLIKKFFK